MTTWGDIYNNAVLRGIDHGAAAWLADCFEKRLNMGSMYDDLDVDPGDFMDLEDAEAFVFLAKKMNVSKVARSSKGFMGAYRRAKGDPERLEDMKVPKMKNQTWMNRRNGFVSRHMAQMENEELWDDEGNPTRRHLALIMWAYTPDPEGVEDWIEENA